MIEQASNFFPPHVDLHVSDALPDSTLQVIQAWRPSGSVVFFGILELYIALTERISSHLMAN